MKKVAIVAYDGCWAMSVFSVTGFYRVVSLLEQHIGDEKSYLPVIVSADGKNVTSACGATITVEESIVSDNSYDLIVIPPVEGPKIDALAKATTSVVTWLKEQIRKNTPILSLTTGAYLLAATEEVSKGLIATHWAFVNKLRQLFPDCQFTSSHSYIHQDNITSTGTLNATFDALLSMLTELKGNNFAQYCAAHLLVTEVSQLSPIIPNSRNHDDDAIFSVQEWLETNFQQHMPIPQLAAQFGFSERNLKRRFTAATNRSLNQYLQEVRIDKAKKLLITSTLNIKQIAYEVGYENDGFFSRIFKASTGNTPRQWRNNYPKDI